MTGKTPDMVYLTGGLMGDCLTEDCLTMPGKICLIRFAWHGLRSKDDMPGRIILAGSVWICMELRILGYILKQ